MPDSTSRAVGTGFSLPAETFTPQAELAPLQQELARENYTDAAARLDALLRDHADELMPLDGGVLSFWSWLCTLPGEQRSGLIGAYRKRFDDAARERFEDVRANPTTTPEQLYAVARRHPFSSSAPTALILAAERSIDLGDPYAAAVYYDLARRHGWVPDTKELQLIATQYRLANGEPFLPAMAVKPGNPTTGPAQPAPYFGLIPIDATWLNNPTVVGQGRYQPAAAGNQIFFSAARMVAAFRDSGQSVWGYVAPPNAFAQKPVAPVNRKEDLRKLLPDRIEGAHRPAVYTPAVLCDVYGQAQIVVARQSTDRDRQYILRAFRASDGKLLWSSDDQPQLRDLSFAGTPAIGGRAIYAVALLVEQPARDNATVVLAAIDTLHGQLLWQATVGVFTIPRDKKIRSPVVAPWDDVWEQSEPLVAGDAVYVTPNAGVAVKVGRFDGKVRWARPYAATQANDDPARSKDDLRKVMEERRELLRQAKEARNHGLPPPVILPPPLDPALTERYTSTPRVCGDRVLIAPADSFGVFALDIDTGRQIWEKKDPDIPTLIGATTTAAVFAGAAVTALSPANGQTIWKWEPPRGGWITGPVVMGQNVIHIPTNTAIISLSATDGTIVNSHQVTTLPSWRRVLASEALHKMIDDAGAGKSFGMPPAP